MSLPYGIESSKSFNTPLVMIGIISAALAFVVALQWNAFTVSSLDAIQERTGNRFPKPAATFLSAVTVTAATVGLLFLLHIWSRKVVR